MLKSSLSMTTLQHKCSLFLPSEQYEHDDRTMDLFPQEQEFVEVWKSGELPCSVHWLSSLPCSARAGPQRNANSCSTGRGTLCSALPTPQQPCLQGHMCASGHRAAGSELITPHAHRDEGSSTQRDLRLPGAGWAQLSLTGPGWGRACVDLTDVWERWWLTDSSSISCTLLSQSLPAAVWRRPSPAHQEITSDNSGKHVCYPFMHASNLGPKSGCAKRFSPEEMCLLINIYWINWFPICSAVLLRLKSSCCYWNVSGVVTTQEVHQNTSVNLKN